MERPGEDTLVKYFLGHCTEEEEKLIVLYLAMDIDQEYVAACMKEAAAKMNAQPAEEWTSEKHQAAWHKIGKLKLSFPAADLENADYKSIAGKKIRLWKSLAIAASVILCLSVAGLYFNTFKKSSPQLARSASAVAADHAPGKNKAVLILADGRKIDLTEAKSGALAVQGETQVIKTAADELVYDENNDDSDNTPAAINTLLVPQGGQYTLTLPDGSKVWMNAASTLQFPARFTGNKREVILTGEAYFEVAKNTKMPFSVKLNKMQVEVLGTHFNIMAYADEPVIRTTLLEGSVKLTNSNGQQMLKPGQDGILGNTNHFKVKAANIEQAMAWKNGQFIFDDEDMPAISRKLSRWYGVTVTDQRQQKGLTYTGAISKYKYVSEVLKMLEMTGTMHFKIENDKVTIKP